MSDIISEQIKTLYEIIGEMKNEVKEPDRSKDTDEITKALCELQKELPSAPKMTTNPQFSSKYADLTSIWDTCRKKLAESGLAIVQTTIPDRHSIILKTTLLHVSGQWISGIIQVTPTKDTPQGTGTAITYARRYSLAAMIGMVSDEDDDGNKSSELDNPPPAKPAKPANTGKGTISKAQVRRLFAKGKDNGYTTDQIKNILEAKDYKKSSEILKKDYDDIINSLSPIPEDDGAVLDQKDIDW